MTCGGALIDSVTVLTARHCVKKITVKEDEAKQTAEWINQMDRFANPELWAEPFWRDYAIARDNNEVEVVGTVYLDCKAA